MDTSNIISRKEKEKLLKQKGMTIWFTGLPCSGKSSLAYALEKALFTMGFFTLILDSDIIRPALNKDLGYSMDDRMENIRRVASLARLLNRNGIITLATFISPTHEIRSMAREIIGKEDYFEVYVNTPVSICEKRDIKGQYLKARQGLLNDFTGVSSLYQKPENSDLVIDTSGKSIEACMKPLVNLLIPKLYLRDARYS